MGIVVPFRRPTATAGNSIVADADRHARTEAVDRIEAAVHAGFDWHVVLAAAAPLLAICRDLHGFTVMRSGLPSDPAQLAAALISLGDALNLLANGRRPKRPLSTFGVYFGQPALAWIEDGYGGTMGLAVPTGTTPDVLATFIGQRLRQPRNLSVAD